MGLGTYSSVLAMITPRTSAMYSRSDTTVFTSSAGEVRRPVIMAWSLKIELDWPPYHWIYLNLIRHYLLFASLQAKCVSGGGSEYVRGSARMSISEHQWFADDTRAYLNVHLLRYPLEFHCPLCLLALVYFSTYSIFL